jgi:DNA repair exonuclease SbcCD ATPase subunit
MRSSRWLMAGLGVALVLAGCTESSKLTLAELERHKREVDKQMRLVREQNEQINSKLNLLKAEMDTIKTVYIPAVKVALDSVAAKPEQARIQTLQEVQNQLMTIRTDYREFKEKVTETVTTNDKKLNDEVRSKLDSFEKQINSAQEKVDFVLAQQDSVNREFAIRIDKRPWYKSIMGSWEDQQRQKNGTP